MSSFRVNEIEVTASSFVILEIEIIGVDKHYIIINVIFTVTVLLCNIDFCYGI